MVFSHDKAELFLRDLRAAITWLDDLAAHLGVSARVGTPP
jgi:hypothetical protein